MNHVACKLLAVVLDKRYPAAEPRILRVLVDLLQDPLALLVGRVGLPGEDELHRPPAVVHDLLQPVQVLEDDIRPLILGKPAGEPDRQRRCVEHQPFGSEV